MDAAWRHGGLREKVTIYRKKRGPSLLNTEALTDFLKVVQQESRDGKRTEWKEGKLKDTSELNKLCRRGLNSSSPLLQESGQPVNRQQA